VQKEASRYVSNDYFQDEDCNDSLSESVKNYGMVKGIWRWCYTRRFLLGVGGALTSISLFIILPKVAQSFFDGKIKTYDWEGIYNYLQDTISSIEILKIALIAIFSSGLAIRLYGKSARKIKYYMVGFNCSVIVLIILFVLNEISI
jgi:hypothetical protein